MANFNKLCLHNYLFNLKFNKVSRVISIVIFTFFYLAIGFCQDDKIIVGGDYNYPPYSFIDKNGNETGYDVDVINGIAKITGLDTEFKFDDWNTTLTKLKTGEINIISSIVYSAEREKIYDFSFPLHTEYYGIFAKKTTKIDDVNDLGLKKPAILVGDISNEMFFKPMGLFKNYIEVSSFPEAFNLVNSNKCDYVIVPYPLGMKVIKDNKFSDIELKGPPIIPIVYCLAVKEGDSELLAFLNQGIEILNRNGELDKIYDKWVKYKRQDDQYEELFYYSLIWVLILLAVVIVLVLFWFSLKVQVNKKAKIIKANEHVNYLKLQKAKKEVDLANKAKSVFLSTISHEIRTPLFAIIGFTDLLNKTGLSEKQSAYNRKVKISGRLLLNLVNDVLDITKLEAEKIVIKKNIFKITELISEICDIESIKANEKGIELLSNIADDVPEVVIGDKLRLSQILLNIVSNSIKFTDKGKVNLLVNVENLSELAAKEKINIIFSVKDTGIGMDSHSQEKLFIPFEQIHNTSERKYSGTGLGLAISKQLVDLMNGDILVESTIGKGSVFNVSIPLQIFRGDIENCDDKKLKEISDEKITVLLVEDNIFNAEILIEQLTEANYEATHAKSGIEAIEILKENNFQIILMDIEMPKMGGFETMEKIKKLNISKASVIAISAHDLHSEKEKAIKAGMRDYLCKPISVQELNGTILKYKDSFDKKNTQSAIDYNKGLAFFENDNKKYKRALLRFAKHYKNIPEKLALIYKENPELIKDYTHNLKSAGKTIGALKLSE
ncbi:MAG: hypothetical protein B6I20_07160, partial [Bacteroidetes bacterium 4572_117]